MFLYRDTFLQGDIVNMGTRDAKGTSDSQRLCYKELVRGRYVNVSSNETSFQQGEKFRVLVKF